MDVRNIRLKIAYDGTNYAGWQTQPGLPTIQESVEQAIGKMTGERPRLIGSGRTDAGVHAHGQIATFYTTKTYSPHSFQSAINAFLPDSIRILYADEVPQSFHPTLDSVSKRYRYRVDNSPVADPILFRYAHHIPRLLEQSRMQQAAGFLVGRHDFAAFQTVGSERMSTVRTILACDVIQHGSEIHIEVEADGFLYNMVRTIAGTLNLVGTGKWDPERVGQIIKSADRKLAGPTAPAKGLAMLWVKYEI
ncbi:MAG: tRNA pseudouridine synthase [Planctomycetota bacterium]|jgi:tRNA pseudouridine38-40 synthase